MEKIIQFDLCSIVLLLVLLFSTILRKMTKGSSNRMYLTLLATVILSTVFSILCTLLDYGSGISSAAKYTVHMLYLLFHNMSSPVYVLYIISLADTWHRLLRSKAQLCIITVPFLVLVILMFLNAVNHNMFEIYNGVYVHRELFNAVYIISGFYMALGVVYLLINRKLISKLKIISILSMVILLIIAIIVQYVQPAYAVEMFACTLSLLIITMTTQRPEEILDARTGLNNYNSYADNIKRSFETGKEFSIIMLNIGNFASLQSMLTYDSTVNMLRSIAKLMQDTVKNDMIAAEMYYLDRGKFRIVLSRNKRKHAPAIAESLSNILKTNMSVNNLSIGLNPRICLVNCPEDVKDFATLSAFGANFHERCSEEAVAHASDLFMLKNFEMANNIDLIIDKAIVNNNFKVYYQPIYSVEKGRFTTAEALLRLIDDEYGFVPPDMFIPAAEKNGAIHKIGDFVLEDVCRFIASDDFRRLGLDYIEINLSVAQCMHGDLAERILETLKKYNISSDKINLEITETAVSFGQNAMKQNLDRLSEAGVSFSLDDYGTGYSNMKRVVQLPLKIVKLDKSFVDEQNNPKMWIVLQNTVKMLKDMNIEIVVEGIENEQMVTLFTELNCDYIQGYFFSKPIPEEQFVTFIKEAHKIT